MAGANSVTNLIGLDFDTIKTNLKTFLQSQSTFKDYNFDGSGLSVLLDILSYNTMYQAFYLNQISGEMFLDSALQRPSVISHAKLLNYTPKSSSAPVAYVDIISNDITTGSITLPAYTNFLSESVDGINYNFITTNTISVNTSNSSAKFINVELKQGIPITYTFVVDSTSNPTYLFNLPDNTIDTSTFNVKVQTSSANTFFEVYTLADNYLTLDGTSKVFFLQESLNGSYDIYFGDGILGNKLSDGNIVIVSCITTQGTSSTGANSFVIMDVVPNLNNITINGKIPAYQGSEKESIDSIKFQAPKSFYSQNRAITKQDYINLIQKNSLGYSFDAVNVWGGEENDPIVYGKVFVCLKPSGSYTLTSTQKERLISDVISPLSVMTVSPVIVDPDYTYIQLSINVLFNPNKTNLLPGQIESVVKSSVNSFSNSTLNTFNSTFDENELLNSIKSSEQSIQTCESSTRIQKKIIPDLINPTNYVLNFGVPIEKGMLQSGIGSYPSLSFRNKSNLSNIINGIYIEEVPSNTYGIYSISIINPGFKYQYAPIVSILGDGVGAIAEAVINTNGQITKINIINEGTGYTSALVTISPQPNDSTGSSGEAQAILKNKFGTLRLYYYDDKRIKIIYDSNIGTVDYDNGKVYLNNFNPYDVNNTLGQLGISAKPTSTIISSNFNNIITIDTNDSSAISVNVSAKK